MIFLHSFCFRNAIFSETSLPLSYTYIHVCTYIYVHTHAYRHTCTHNTYTHTSACMNPCSLMVEPMCCGRTVSALKLLGFISRPEGIMNTQRISVTMVTQQVQVHFDS